MPSFLNGLFPRKPPANAVPRAVSNSRGQIAAVANMQSWDTDQAIIQGYERVIWVYRCVDAIASNSSSVPMLVREYDDEDGLAVDSPELLKLLNRRPNIYETAQQFRYRLASQLLLSRRGVFVEVVRAKGGHPKELHLLPPGTTAPIPDADTYVSGYQVQTVSQGIVELAPEQVLWIRAKPHPTDVYGQMTPLVSAGLAADTDFLARLYNRNFLRNDGRPGMLIAVQGQLMPEDAEEVRRRFAGGPQAAGRTTVIEADGLDATDMGANPRDVQWQEAVSGSKRDILLAFGVPESVLGDASNRTFSNADAEFEVFWMATMKPFMDSIGAGFDILTDGALDDNLYVAHDYDAVDVLQRQKRARQDKALEEFKAGVLTIDQYLTAVGREPLAVPGTEVLWLQQGLVPVGGDDQTTKAAASLMPVGQPPAPDPSQQAYQGAYQGASSGYQSYTDDAAARALRLAGERYNPFETRADTPAIETKEAAPADRIIEMDDEAHPYWVARLAAETQIEALASAWSARQERVVLARMGGVKARKGTRHWDGPAGQPTKALNARYIVSPEEWADDLAESIADVARAVAEQEALRVARELAAEGVIDAFLADGNGYPNARVPLDRLVGGRSGPRTEILLAPQIDVERMVRESALRQSRKIAERIEELDRDGVPLDEIRREVSRMVDSRSSWRKGIAVAATTTLIEGARNRVFATIGDKYLRREWRTQMDERVRPAHRKAHGQIRSATRPFLVGGVHMMYPGDPSAPIELTAGCRCFTRPRLRTLREEPAPVEATPTAPTPKPTRPKPTRPKPTPASPPSHQGVVASLLSRIGSLLKR